jgi:polyhydroxyalkanoate synthesis regulator phasin
MAEANQQLFDLWKKQVEDGTQAWLRMLGQPAGSPITPTMDPQAFWKPFLDQGIAAWSRVMTQGPVSPDLMSQWKQFLDQWIAAWSKALEQAMGTDAFAQALGKQLEGFLNAAGPVKKAADQQIEATLGSLGVPSRSQVTGIAQQIVQLEEKVEAVEDRVGLVLARLDEIRAALARAGSPDLR